MQTRNLIRTLAISVGLVAAVSVHLWPDQAPYTQMALYSAIVLVPLLMGLWSHIQQPGFWKGMGSVLLLHVLVLFAIRPVFPFKTVFIIVPMALVEGIIAFIFALRFLED